MPDKIPEQLIIRFLTNEASPQEQESLLDWISFDSRNQKIFQEYVEAWESKDTGSAAYDVGKGLLRLNQKINEAEKQESKKIARFSWQKVAATITFILIASSAVLFYQRIPSSEQAITYVNTTTSNERKTIELNDGSIVQMNVGSSLKYPVKFITDKREVYLIGEAFFSVKRDEGRPFIIHTGNLRTEVLGTSFNIKARRDAIAVTVATGKVSVSVGHETTTLVPNNMAIYNRNTGVLKTQNAELERELAWLNSTINFDDTDLASAAKTLEKMYAVKITFENHIVKKCVITGKFKGESLEHILDAIAFSAGIEYKMKNKEVIISGKGCE